ncbi:MAG: hypothetical protein EKK33_33810 [Bradyrhizobiaceae bacterium]|nr:MAG: hypothetical protein EKK33_33810 [Bradyrhizobiaceae bacterium]
MSFAYRLLLLFILSIPFLPAVDPAWLRPAAALGGAAMLGLAAIAPRQDLLAASRELRIFSLALLFPLVWMLLQVVPVPDSLANPIWHMASAALKQSSGLSTVSVAPDNTLGCLFAWLSLVAIFVAGLIICRDRTRAAACFLALGVVTTLISLQALLGRLGIPEGLPAASGMFFMSAMGLLVNSGILIASWGRLRRRSADRPSGGEWVKLAVAVLGIVVCGDVLRVSAQLADLIVALSGPATLFFIAMARRLRSGPRLALTAYLAITALAALLAGPQWQESWSIPGLARSSDMDAVAAAQRAIANTPALGNGVGSFASTISIYQDMRASPILPVSAMSSVAVEWGRPALLIVLVLALQFFTHAFVGAIGRGRDWLYPSTAAASVFVITADAFLGPSLLEGTSQILVAVILAIGASQVGSHSMATD